MAKQTVGRRALLCKRCGRPLLAWPSEIRRGKRFCSRRCTRPPPAEAFWSNVIRSRACWGWRGEITPNGYGRFMTQHRRRSAHRFSWELHFGPIPGAVFVCHHCDNKCCSKPSHLFLGTNRDNQLDAVRKFGSWALRGERSRTAKLTWSDVAKIRAALAAGEKGSVLARRYGVCDAQVHRIRYGTRWAQ